MEKLTRLVNGILTTVNVSTATPTVYEQSVLITTDIGVAGTNYDITHTVITLPNGEKYDGTKQDLEVFVGDSLDGGLKLVEGTDFDYGPGTQETTITSLRAFPKDTRINFRKVT